MLLLRLVTPSGTESYHRDSGSDLHLYATVMNSEPTADSVSESDLASCDYHCDGGVPPLPPPSDTHGYVSVTGPDPRALSERDNQNFVGEPPSI